MGSTNCRRYMCDKCGSVIDPRSSNHGYCSRCYDEILKARKEFFERQDAKLVVARQTADFVPLEVYI